MKKNGAIFFLLLLLSCTNQTAYIKETPKLTKLPQLSSAEIEKFAHIKIPSSAFNVQTYAEMDGMDDVILVRFNLPSSDLDSFLESHNFKNLKQGCWSIQNGPPSVAWWPRREVVSKFPLVFYWGDKLRAPGFSQSVLVDKSIEDVYAIYLQYFEM